MNSRDSILNRITNLKMANVPLKDLSLLPQSNSIDMAKLKENVEKSGATFAMSSPSLKEIINERYKHATNIVSGIDEIPSTFVADKKQKAKELAQIDLAILKGSFIVEENGTIWLDEANMINRTLFCLANELILVVDKDNIVKNMHEAYSQKKFKVGNNGVFISGPSKTADIEQSLVIGAQGATGLLVYLNGY